MTTLPDPMAQRLQTMRRLTRCMGLAFALFVSCVARPFAQDAMPPVPTSSEATHIGKTYYFLFSRDRCRHPNSFSIVPTPSAFDTRRVAFPNGQSFVIENLVRGEESKNSRYFKVTFQDGSIGYVDASQFRVDSDANDKSLREGCNYRGTAEDVESKVRAAEVRAANAAREEEKSIAKEKADRDAEKRYRAEVASRPGVRIGMTAKDIIEKSNWGKPESVNRTVSAAGTREQWVYGDGEYLYFTNGRLTAIQTRGTK